MGFTHTSGSQLPLQGTSDSKFQPLEPLVTSYSGNWMPWTLLRYCSRSTSVLSNVAEQVHRWSRASPIQFGHRQLPNRNICLITTRGPGSGWFIDTHSPHAELFLDHLALTGSWHILYTFEP